MFFSTTFRLFSISSLLLAALSIMGCKDYPYTSPTPGTLEVRLKTVSNNIPLGPGNFLEMQLTAVRAVRHDYAKQEVFEDKLAIRRYTEYYDALSQGAFDSTLQLGEAYSPPGSYLGIDLTTQPAGFVVLDGYRTIPIQFAADAESFLPLRVPITIEEAKTTVVVISFDVDSSLVRGAETFHYHPKFYISSLQIH
jgi:hypothetical protein